MTQKPLLLDPTDERISAKRERLPRPASLDGLTVGLLDISKARGDIFLNQIETHLTQRGLTVKRYQKPTFARLAPTKLQQKISDECDIVVEALAD